MRPIPPAVSEFLKAERIAVAGASRDPHQPANLIARRLRDTGHDVVLVNPKTTEIEGQPCYPSLRAVPGKLDAVVVVTHPSASADVVRQATERGVDKIWFHRSFGDGSVSAEALTACGTRGVEPIVGGCPMMYGENADLGHRCMRWLLNLGHRVPA